jgi:large subunit ribosomal protein L15
VPPYFEGGQLPLIRRLPFIRGFTNPFRIEYAVVNIELLGRFKAGTEVTPDLLHELGIIKAKMPVKVLGQGELDHPLTVKASKFSATAREKILAAGGSVLELE